MWRYAKCANVPISRIEKINKLNKKTNKCAANWHISTLAYWHIIKLWNLHLKQ